MFSRVLGFARIATTTIADATKAVLASVVGPAGGLDDGEDTDDSGEKASGQEFFTGLGLVVRPLPANKQGAAEAVCARTGDGLVPLTYRDLRLHANFPAPKEGTVALVGYAGAFDSNDSTVDADGKPVSSTRTIYVPYAFVGGVPTKALCITIDGTEGNESISIVHGDGMAIVMKSGGKKSVTMKNAAGDAYVEVNDDGGVLNGNWLVTGSLTCGGETAAPVMLGTTTPATKLFAT